MLAGRRAREQNSSDLPTLPLSFQGCVVEMRFSVAGTTSRRRFARGMLPALIVSFAIPLPWLTRAAAPANLGALLRKRAGAERIGRRYLATMPVGTDKARLLAMSPALDHAACAVRHQPEVAAALLRRGINDDFRHANTVIVDGWVLAATEARLCAVVALA